MGVELRYSMPEFNLRQAREQNDQHKTTIKHDADIAFIVWYVIR